MRKLILAFTLCLLTANAQAMILDLSYTGFTAERIDPCGYGCGADSGGGYIGGPAGTNSFGWATQFNIDSLTYIRYLLASARARADNVPDGQTASLIYDYKMYSGTLANYGGNSSALYPDVGTLLLSSPVELFTWSETQYFPEIDAWHTFARDGIYTDVPILFDVTLTPGTYWLAYETRQSGGGIMVDQLSTKTLVNPEPATFILFAGGLLGAFARRRKRS